jgi:hypothetical protein
VIGDHGTLVAKHVEEEHKVELELSYNNPQMVEALAQF